jgi:hypothetical protein
MENKERTERGQEKEENAPGKAPIRTCWGAQVIRDLAHRNRKRYDAAVRVDPIARMQY